MTPGPLSSPGVAGEARPVRSGFFWCGSYTETMDGSGSGIGVLKANGGDAVEFLGSAVETSSPSFLARNADVLYAVDEANALIRSFRVVQNALEPWEEQPTSGSLPCHIATDGDWLYVSNYGSGGLDVFPIDPSGGLGALAQTCEGSGNGPHAAQGGPHAHSALVVGSSVYSADLGADRVHVHRREGGVLVRTASIELPPGTGPRDLAVVGDRVLVLAELSQRVLELADGEVVASGALVADPVAGDHAAALVPDARGRFLYTVLRGSDRVAVIDARTLEPVFAIASGGEWPRHLAFSGDRLFVANQKSSTVTSFLADPATGILSPAGLPESVPSPTYLLPARPLDFVEQESLVK